MSRWNEDRFVPSMNGIVQSFPWGGVGAVCSCVIFFLAFFSHTLRKRGSQQQETHERSWAVHKVPAERL